MLVTPWSKKVPYKFSHTGQYSLGLHANTGEMGTNLELTKYFQYSGKEYGI